MGRAAVICKPHKSINCNVYGCKGITKYLIGAVKPYSERHVLHVCEDCFQSIVKSAMELNPAACSCDRGKPADFNISKRNPAFLRELASKPAALRLSREQPADRRAEAVTPHDLRSDIMPPAAKRLDKSKLA